MEYSKEDLMEAKKQMDAEQKFKLKQQKKKAKHRGH